jgi:hypothetical protein
LLGRYLTAADDERGSPSGPPAAISEGYWARRPAQRSPCDRSSTHLQRSPLYHRGSDAEELHRNRPHLNVSLAQANALLSPVTQSILNRRDNARGADQWVQDAKKHHFRLLVEPGSAGFAWLRQFYRTLSWHSAPACCSPWHSSEPLSAKK